MKSAFVLSIALLALSSPAPAAQDFVYDELRMVVNPPEPEVEVVKPVEKKAAPSAEPVVVTAQETPVDTVKPCVGENCVKPPQTSAPDFKSIAQGPARKKAFINYFGPQAAALQKATGYPASLMLAQWAEESGWGSSKNFQALNSISGHRCWNRGAQNNSRIEIPGFEREIRTECVPGVGGKILYLKFESPLDATLSYMQNLLYSESTARAYRSIRAEVAKQQKKVDWKKLMPGLKSYCPYPSYQTKIPNLLRRNGLEEWETKDLCSCY